jgi:hypothetical protein
MSLINYPAFLKSKISKLDPKIGNLRGVKNLKGYSDCKSYDQGSGLQILNSVDSVEIRT